MKRNSSLLKKIYSRSGESLAEVLVAILICAVSLLMLSTAIYSAGNILDRSGQKMTEMYDGINHMDSVEHMEARIKVEGEVTEATGKSLTISGINSMPDSVTIAIYQDTATGLASYKAKENTP